jgi:FkbM family methyltransferase
MHHKIARASSLAADLARSQEARNRCRRALFWRLSRHYASAVEAEHNGLRYLVNTHDPWISRDLFITGRYEGESIDNVYKELARRDRLPDQVLDVGANVGLITIELLSKRPEATAVAFEPDARNFRLLRQNLIGNGFDDRVLTHQLAISDMDGPVTLELSDTNPGDHRVKPSDKSGSVQDEPRPTITVEARRLDSLMASNAFARTDRTLVWMDIQGHEASALAGFGGLVGNPTVVEFWPYALKRAGDLERFCDLIFGWPEIVEVGRALQPLTRQDLLRRMDEIELVGGGYHTDLLLIPGRD